MHFPLARTTKREAASQRARKGSVYRGEGEGGGGKWKCVQVSLCVCVYVHKIDCQLNSIKRPSTNKSLLDLLDVTNSIYLQLV